MGLGATGGWAGAGGYGADGSVCLGSPVAPAGRAGVACSELTDCSGAAVGGEGGTEVQGSRSAEGTGSP